MKRIIAALAISAALVCSAAAQTGFAPVPGSSPAAPLATPIPAPVAAPTIIVPAPKITEQGGGVINIGQAFSTILAPYINAAVNALILAFVGWLGMILKNKFNVTIDEGHRAALVTALQNQAGSLIADGVVKMQGTRVTVPNAALAESANEIMAVIPDAAARLGFTPDYLAKRIIDVIPQTAAGAAMIAAAQPKPVVAATAAVPGPAGPKLAG